MGDDLRFEEPVWEALDGFLKHLPEPVKLVVWAATDGNRYEKEALQLGRRLAHRYEILSLERRDRAPGYPYYPLLGVMREAPEGEVDHRIRFVGVPAGYQINALVGAIQAVSFQAQNLEARTRFQLSRLPEEAEINIEVLTTAVDESGPLVATLAAGIAVASPQVRTFIIMADIFSQALVRYSARTVPHTVINRRVHVSGVFDEAAMLKQIARAVPRS
ncbi:MAG: hypothetical protein R3272_00725 [Candidatus Promineifilaceae bacterium]|nr:hypothetical protein [Candidatus Promineifilaceae bacterium]